MTYTTITGICHRPQTKRQQPGVKCNETIQAKKFLSARKKVSTQECGETKEGGSPLTAAYAINVLQSVTEIFPIREIHTQVY